MFAQERRREIINILRKKTKVRVRELSESFGVSEVIIRKDLKLLEEEGRLERTHGGAILKKERPEDISLKRRRETNREGKDKLAMKLYNIIEEGEAIFLDSSSTNLVLAEKLAENPKKVTIITNMLKIMTKLEAVEKVDLIGIGGLYNREVGNFLGGTAEESILGVNSQKLFLGGAGIDIHKGNISIFQGDETPIKKAMIKMTSRVYFICEKQKFQSYGLYNFAKIDEVDVIVVDEPLDKEIRDVFEDRGIEVI